MVLRTAVAHRRVVPWGGGLHGWHSEQEGDPPGGRIPFKFVRKRNRNFAY